tara:strand:- start:11 stop:343 length:333 start_codon:yes stop_codon:yes gene_type:complete
LRITLVKKILASGEPCRKCRDVEQRLKDGGHWPRIDEVITADERDPNSPGMRLAKDLNIDLAPFFVVRDNGAVTIYTLYFKFVKEVLQSSHRQSDADKELLENNPDLDFI